MRQLWILVALVACNKPGGESGGGGLGPPVPTDWSSKKLVGQQGTVEHLAFTIDVPEGLPRDKRQGGDWDSQDPAYDKTPKVFTSTIEIARVQDLKEAKYHATLDAAQKTWVREQSRPDSWALTYAEADKSRIEAVTYKEATDTLFIKCKAVQATGGGPIPNYAKARTMLETICDSLKPTGAAPPAAETPEPVEKGDDEPTPTEKAPDEGAEGNEGGTRKLKKAAGESSL